MVRMAGLMAYTLTEDRGVDLPDTGAWTLVRKQRMQRGSGCAFLCWASWLGSFHLPLELPPVCFGRPTHSTRSARSIL